MDTEELLSFKEFPMTHTVGTGGQSGGGIAKLEVNQQSKPKSNPLQDLLQITTEPNPPNDQSPTGDGKTTTNHSFLTIEYYQKWFDVDTFMVLDRIASSMIPKRAAGNYLKSEISANPDLYGPTWIIITLIFSIAISGNIANYLQLSTDASHPKAWHYNFHLVSYAATAIILYACLLPAVLWGLFKWSLKPVDPNFETETSSFTPSLLSLLCVYGYSLAIYIPVSILWMIPISSLQWLLVMTAGTLSGSVLMFVLMPAIKNSHFSFLIMIAVVAAHFLLAISFMVYFFHVPKSDVPASIPPIVEHPAVTEVLKKVVSEKSS